MTATTRLYTLFHGCLVGRDAAGNRYYREKRPLKNRREKRWVIYHGAAEPSRIPPEWFGWMHHTTDTPPTQKTIKRYGWEKPPQPNLSGTIKAYMPQGHLNRQGEHAPTIAEYQPWQPS